MLFGLMSGMAFAEHREYEQKSSISTLILLKHDFVFPDKGKSFMSEALSLWWHVDDWFGIGGDFTAQPGNNNYLDASSYITINKKKSPIYGLMGYFTNSNGEDFIHTGGWYIDKFGKIDVFADVRNYWAVDGKSSSYLDSFGEATYALGDKFAPGINLEQIHYWSGGSHNWYFAGPIVYYKISETTTVYVRGSREWNVVGSASDSTNKVRVALKFNF